jgi:hypothetical protein
MQRLSDFRLPELRLPSSRLLNLRRLDLRRPNLRRPSMPSLRLRKPELDLDRPRRYTEPLQFFFYLLMFVALLAIFSGATGSGVAMLIIGAALHVARSSLLEIAAQRQARRERAGRKRQVRLRSHRTARQAREAGAPPAPAATPTPRLQPAAPEIRVSAARRRPRVAQPGASPARKQRVI